MAITTGVVDSNLTTGAVAYMTSGTNDVFQIVKATVTNNNAATTRAITVYIEATGGAATNPIINTLTLAAKETKTLSLSGHAVKTGGILYAKQDVGTDVLMYITYTATTV